MLSLVALGSWTVALAASPASAAAVAPFDETQKWDVETITLFVCKSEPHMKTEDLLLATALAAATWNETGAGPRIDVAGTGACDTIVEHDNVNRVGFVNGAWSYPEAAYASTFVGRNGDGTIVETDIALNPNKELALSASTDAGASDVWAVLTHEIGHVLGLPDVTEDVDATMYHQAHLGETAKRDLATSDETQLLKLYENIDSAHAGCSAVGRSAEPIAVLALTLLLPRIRRKTLTRPAPRTTTQEIA